MMKQVHVHRVKLTNPNMKGIKPFHHPPIKKIAMTKIDLCYDFLQIYIIRISPLMNKPHDYKLHQIELIHIQFQIWCIKALQMISFQPNRLLIYQLKSHKLKNSNLINWIQVLINLVGIIYSRV